jgi:hypothetical protein
VPCLAVTLVILICSRVLELLVRWQQQQWAHPAKHALAPQMSPPAAGWVTTAPLCVRPTASTRHAAQDMPSKDRDNSTETHGCSCFLISCATARALLPALRHPMHRSWCCPRPPRSPM